MRLIALAALCVLGITPAFAADKTLTAPKTGVAAPVFSAPDTKGVTQSLTAYKGKVVVLEWTNAECPYVKKHYDSGNMQNLQKMATDAGTVWLRINSGAPGKQGHLSAQESDALAAKQNVAATATILDETGTIGRMYGAKTTPAIAIINRDGILVYQGAIDDRPTSDPADIPNAKNYVKTVLDDLAAGRPASVTTTQSYGCGVKY